MGPSPTKGIDHRLQELLEKQGYIIVGSHDNYVKGAVMNDINWSLCKGVVDIRNDISVVVVDDSTYQEMVDQFRSLNLEGEPPQETFIHYYRVVAE